MGNPTTGPLLKPSNPKVDGLKCFVDMKLINLILFFQTDDVKKIMLHICTNTDGWGVTIAIRKLLEAVVCVSHFADGSYFGHPPSSVHLHNLQSTQGLQKIA